MSTRGEGGENLTISATTIGREGGENLTISATTRRALWRWTGVGVVLLAGVVAVFGQNNREGKGRRSGGGNGEVRMPAAAFRTEVPARDYDVILVRPTRDSMSVSVLAYRDLRATLRLGRSADALTLDAATVDLKAGQPALVTFGKLQAGTRYFYRFEPAAESGVAAGEVASFTTARAPGESFCFTIQADSHLDAGTEPALYERSLARVRASRPDFHVDLGDTFMTDKRGSDFRAAEANYLAQRYYFGRLGGAVPLFLALGNHDGETAVRSGGGQEAMPVWSNAQRKALFPNPRPDAFYSGNATPHPRAGVLENYYAWEWGDALFVVLDPFWFSGRIGREGDVWERTLGRAQYDWLRGVLARSGAKWKFVFLHHLVGGIASEGRGGDAAVPLYEWGGRGADGRDEFAARRPGWEAPIHALLVKHGVTAVFHGHDHLFAQQVVDGIVYQELPQPAHPRPNARNAAEYGYRGGEIFGASGVMRVRVGPDEAALEFLDVKGGDDVVAHTLRLTPAAQRNK